MRDGPFIRPDFPHRAVSQNPKADSKPSVGLALIRMSAIIQCWPQHPLHHRYMRMARENRERRTIDQNALKAEALRLNQDILREEALRLRGRILF